MLENNQSLRVASDNPLILLLIGIFIVLAAINVAIMDLFHGLTMEGYSYIADTISNLAAGKGSTILDISIQVFSISIALLSFGLWRLGQLTNDVKWTYSLACVLLIVIAVVINFIAAYDAYFNDVDSTALTIHRWLTYALYSCFAAVTFLMASKFDEYSKIWGKYSRITGALWLVSAPIFMFMPTHMDGLYERFVATQLILWIMVSAVMLIMIGVKSGAREKLRNLYLRAG